MFCISFSALILVLRWQEWYQVIPIDKYVGKRTYHGKWHTVYRSTAFLLPNQLCKNIKGTQSNKDGKLCDPILTNHQTQEVGGIAKFAPTHISLDVQVHTETNNTVTAQL